ncbi:MAG: GAF domain-containing protein [Bdellovibrionales bacterium]|nr:GAF domain-containing protein [Bdellovibrionales bacterium]
MNNSQTWVEALNINPEKLNEWSSQAPSGKPLLVWCLEEGHVDLQEYLLWASERFGLPVLSSAFFESGGMDPQFMISQRHTGNWSPWCFPIDRWDGITYVACVEPPEERHADVRYVLADPRVMLDAWEMTGTGVPVGEEAPMRELDAPIGMNLETKAFTLNFDDSIMQPSTVAAPKKPEVAKPTPQAPPPPTPATPVKTAPVEEKTTVAQMPIVANDDLDATQIDMSGKTMLVRPTAPVEKLNLPSNEAQALQKAFDYLNKIYKHSCVLRVNGNDASFYKADAALKADPSAHMDLEQPSCLRIVIKTGLPYHGYLVDSPTHREFFRALAGNEMPDCVTAVPLKVNGQIWGLLMALGTEELQNLETLGMVEGTAVQLMTALGPTWSRAS